MQAEAAARIGVRLLAIWVVISSAAGLAGIPALDSRVIGYQNAVYFAVAGAVAQVVAGVVLWSCAPWIAQRIGSETWTPDMVIQSTPQLIAQVAVGVLGAYMLSSAVPDALWSIVAISAAKLAGPSPLAGQPAYDAQLGLYTVGGIANAATILARLIIGCFFLFKPSVIGAVITAGQHPRKHDAAQQRVEADEAG
jgi:hypothetical protein